jgi:FMN phosphatase YigB (HAD superfamily)
VLAREGLLGRFQTVQISAEVGFRKPHPRIFEAALQELKLKGEEVLFVGDHPVDDILGARKMGMWTARVEREDPDPLSSFLGVWREEEHPEADVVVPGVEALADELAD